ncbi:vancomycin high temperature exclusion protein [uncultured Roseburia sp.]|uniref:YdcF family protein n=1 Tax=Brotonthovivens ammoniilytica TaxID=2981725 RepID=A0ABT2TPR7_9FIRM|nr:ElyC/SanA/YdcF family protein [Brotonthovivens ammoniilytica]MCU6763696.1 YdcF family protein [Brotonthovivens ammoniilytica]SCJ30918.1 vancomycin high temperature exclusion protein [uncultured Roseburia sp.]
MKWKKRIRCFLIGLLCVVLAVLGVVFGINGYVKYSVKERIITSKEAAQMKDADCILVLGCAVWSGGKPSYMLQDRLDAGIDLYQKHAAPKLLMSGDHGRKDYDEVNTMKNYAMDRGIVSEDVFMDHAGFSTYESMYRAKEIFQAEKVIIVTQEYHLYRALYVADKLGLDAYGVSADARTYSRQSYRELREILARVKDVFTVAVHAKPTYEGEVISIKGDGNLTND